MTQDLTVLVIGAGANADFKFKTKEKNEEKETIAMPTGEQLVEKIADWEAQVVPNLAYGFLSELYLERNLARYSCCDGMPSFCENVSEDLIKFINGSREKKFASIELNSFGYTQSGIGINGCEEYDSIKYDDIKESDSFSRYHKISQIVKHYQPFSMDEILDSIKIGKIDISKWSDDSEESRENLIQAGKDLIALFLLQSEDARVFDYEASCWYRHLRNAIITCGKNKEEIEKKMENFVIISFNYDRSLDYFLRTRVGEFYEKIRVIYPYGSLAGDEKDIRDALWDAKKKDYQKISYGSAKDQKSFETKWKNFQQAKELAVNLKVIGELEEDGDGKKKIEDMQECMKIFGTAYFLGFAFHKENCRIMGLDQQRFEGSRLGLIRYLETNTVFYTNFGDSDKIRDGFNSFFNSVVAKKKFEKKQRELEEKGIKNRKDFFEIGRSSKKGTYDALALDFDFKL